MNQTYLHCPECGRLDRHFFTEGTDPPLLCRCGERSRLSRWIAPMEGDEWIAQAIDDEVSIVRRSNFHGRISHGWYGDRKVLIAKVGDVGGVIEKVILIAEEEARKRNEDSD